MTPLRRLPIHRLAVLVLILIELITLSLGLLNNDTLFSQTKDQQDLSSNKIGEINKIQHYQGEGDSRTIPVNIQLKPVEYFANKVYVATGTNLTATAEILDEKFTNLSITYQWSVKNKTIVTDTKASQIVYKFDLPDPDNFLKVLVVHRPNDTGTSQKNLVVRNPVSVQDPKDKLFLEHGELLQVTMRYTGTGPFTYCHSIRFDDRFKLSNSCQPDIHTDLNEVNITKYLRYVGNYTLSFVVDNLASRTEKHYSVRIIETVRDASVPYVPIVCSIMAVFIILTGVFLTMKFKKTIYTETADFEFIREPDDADEWAEAQTFSQRVRYLLFKAP